MLTVRSVRDLNVAVTSNLHRIDRTAFDVVIGIPRSGMLPATIIATQLQMPLADPRGFIAGIVHGRSGSPVGLPGRMARALLVDDTVNKGDAMLRAVSTLKRDVATITRLAVYGHEHSTEAGHADIVFEVCRGPRAFEWNMNKHKRLSRWCFDMDGVLCRDPTNAENDDGPAYRNFLLNAEPLFLTRRVIGPVITCRLEKYRPETLDWLGRHGIECSELRMMPFASKAERMEAGGRGQWKAEMMTELGSEFFIESSPKQASIIASRTGLPVWCTTTRELA